MVSCTQCGVAYPRVVALFTREIMFVQEWCMLWKRYLGDQRLTF